MTVIAGTTPSRFRWLPLAAAIALAGCGAETIPPPEAASQYADMQAGRRPNYPRQTILLHNLQRVLDRDQRTSARIASLKLTVQLGGEDPLVLEQLAAVLSDPRTPSQLRDEVLSFLLSKDYPELAKYVVKVLPHVRTSQPLRGMLLEWLTRHPSPGLLSEVVKTWGDAQPTSQADEAYFRMIVERVAAKPWDKALLEAINSADFSARGSAMDVLGGRMPLETLKGEMMGMTARTEAVVAIQAFIRRFDYMPTTGAELLAAASVHLTKAQELADAAELCDRWRRDYGYRFNIRDFHLASRLAASPSLVPVSRGELISELSAVLLRRRHIRHWIVPASKPDLSARFDKQVDYLTVADLWNLRLLNEMLSRPSIQAALAVMADQDRADRRRAWGGLVFLQDGKAQAKLYPGDPTAESGDLTYSPSSRCLADGRDALCRFQAHFETVHNALRAGPGVDEIADAKRGNYHLLILTSLSDSAFCAHYCSADGVVVSLGQFPFVR